VTRGRYPRAESPRNVNIHKSPPDPPRPQTGHLRAEGAIWDPHDMQVLVAIFRLQLTLGRYHAVPSGSWVVPSESIRAQQPYYATRAPYSGIARHVERGETQGDGVCAAALSNTEPILLRRLSRMANQTPAFRPLISAHSSSVLSFPQCVSPYMKLGSWTECGTSIRNGPSAVPATSSTRVICLLRSSHMHTYAQYSASQHPGRLSDGPVLLYHRARDKTPRH
jgi:hypothetical protein